MSSQYQKVSQDDPPTLPPPSGKESRVNTGFAKAAIVLNHRLEGIRGKRVSFSSSNSNPTTPKSNMTTGKPAVVVRVEEVAEKDAGQAEPELDPEIKKEQAKIDKSIRILRAVQGTVTGFLSLMIAIFQGRAYVNYLNTKDVPGAWPKTPSLAPTIMLFSVAIAAIVFDLALLVAYFFPRAKIAKYALVVAIKAHWVITSAKTVSYLLTAVACRAGFDQGNASGNNNDLWSWTCSDKAKPMEATNNCDANCTMQGLAWYFSIANIAIEVIGFFIGKLVERRKSIATRKAAGAVELGLDQPEKLDDLAKEVDGELADTTPKAPAKA